ncbi:uncharacterized protein LOC143069662 isoform X3 [Mytilus galloprovincialis]|uniref:Uncharacterized protein n=1 Tax=Mytilus galloprovincialis TaxID=29158 RepID=A0A8B6F7G1_MYTGA|nr:Hypothetical predicted protein [Mytilus galloprovincialis]
MGRGKNRMQRLMETMKWSRYPSDVYEEDPYGDVNCPSPPPNPTGRYGAYTPGRVTPGRPGSRINNATQDYQDQTESRLGYNNDFRYSSPPPMRLQREMTMPARTEESLDPITRQYYNRLFHRSQSPDMNLNRMGRAGGRWRHITSCFANTGSHMSFVEGTVKQVDNNFMLPKRQPAQKISFSNSMANPRTMYRAPSATKRKPKYNSTYYDHAKNGFKYWYQEQNKPMDLGLRKSIGAKGTWLGVAGTLPNPLSGLN